MPVARDVRSLISRPIRFGTVPISNVMSVKVLPPLLSTRHLVIKSSSMPVEDSLVPAMGYPTGGVIAAAEVPARSVKVAP